MKTQSFVETLTGLTSDQQKAIESLRKSQEGRLFIGISLEAVASEFRALNTLRKTDSEKADTDEKAWFAICGYDPSST